MTVKMGADAVLQAIEKVNLDEISVELTKELEEAKSAAQSILKFLKD